MNYEEKYKEALKAVKELREANPSDDGIQNWINDKFPELRKSEDEKIKYEIKVILANTDLSQFALDYTFADMINWLEKHGKQVHGWSKEDERRINRISEFIWKNRKGDTDEIYQQEQDANWLKSIKQRMGWKPTKKQMDALLFVVQHYTPNVTDKLAWDSLKTLEIMYNDLKKL